MAFTTSNVKTAEYAMGLIIETGSWSGASVTTGTITAAVQSSNEPTFCIKTITDFGFTNDNNNEVKPSVSGVAPNQINITFTSNDTGTYYLIGEGC